MPTPERTSRRKTETVRGHVPGSDLSLSKSMATPGPSRRTAIARRVAMAPATVQEQWHVDPSNEGRQRPVLTWMRTA